MHMFSGNLLHTEFPNEIALFLFDYIQIFLERMTFKQCKNIKLPL